MPPGSASPGHRAAAGTADLGSDLKRLRDHFRIDNLISLIEDHELRELGISGLVEVCGRYGIAIDRFPIKDVSIPKDAEAFAKVISKIVQELACGYRIAIHCKGDLGPPEP